MRTASRSRPSGPRSRDTGRARSAGTISTASGSSDADRAGPTRTPRPGAPACPRAARGAAFAPPAPCWSGISGGVSLGSRPGSTLVDKGESGTLHACRPTFAEALPALRRSRCGCAQAGRPIYRARFRLGTVSRASSRRCQAACPERTTTLWLNHLLCYAPRQVGGFICEISAKCCNTQCYQVSTRGR